MRARPVSLHEVPMLPCTTLRARPSPCGQRARRRGYAGRESLITMVGLAVRNCAVAVPGVTTAPPSEPGTGRFSRRLTKLPGSSWTWSGGGKKMSEAGR